MRIFKLLGACSLFTLLFFVGNGCRSTPSQSYNQQFVITFAELSLLYEKEKMANKESDSLYQVKVKGFFKKKGTNQEAFKKEIEKLSADNMLWKEFLRQVTRTIDSLKVAQSKNTDSTTIHK
jgi:hypothetical protein